MAITKVKTLGITDANVTAAKLSTDSVETAKITASNVTNAKLGSDISAAKLTAGTVDNARLPSTISDKTVQATTPITIKGDGSSADGKLILNCSQNSHGVSIQAPPHSAAQSYNLVLPSTAPGANKILQTDGSGNLSWVDAGGGKIGQVLQTVKTDTFSGTSTSYADITGMSVAITPAATSSKILVLYDIKFSMTNGYNAQLGLIRGSTQIYLGDTASARTRASSACWSSGTNAVFNLSGQYLDSPSSTSATTYKLQYNIETGGTCYVGRSLADGDGEGLGRTAQSITVMEVLA